MPLPELDDRALDSLLRDSPGRQSGFDWLVPFVAELGEASRGPVPVVRPALVTLLAEGFVPDVAGPVMSPLPAPADATPARARATSRRTGLRLAARVALGMALATTGTAAAGAAGALPAPAQHAVAKVVAAATPFTLPDTTADKARAGVPGGKDATGASDGVKGLDGRSVGDPVNGDRAPAAPNPVRATTGGPEPKGPAVGANTGATGLDRANQTPAAGNVPTSVPAAGRGPAGPAPKGLGTANKTPAAGNVPTSVPAAASGPADRGNGPSTAGSTPAAGRVPESVPRRP